MKQCSKCKEFKPLSAFARKARAKDGLNYHCRDCTAAYCRANLDAYARRMREWVKRNPDKYAAHAIKSRRKVRGQVNEPTRPKPDACECCGEIPSKMIEDHDHELSDEEVVKIFDSMVVAGGRPNSTAESNPETSEIQRFITTHPMR